ncbi:tRNA (cytidine(34)-2'-O)-methyltransferase [Jiulongibacter sediminis]|uniref:Putative tRNA (cytidine(34)-2'-O)-methyltransferase n=1 Tax=Jiulongibacter sediminis TaxID=1605367 RepID=A0A0P7C5P8_9BACT|nr:tRNA (cytidine(34)-2'-O)-methyltransferase [Jiulongibacter sediminis]KPM47507.1 tRNA methyltransferase [Jiulongibacter sediminis]TBX23301.1 tRNA methyltransferase [Jiulongibacter sediminis]
MPLNIVLIEPEIPNNTGNIGRLSLASGSRLHLVKPFGFEITDKRLKRAGLDYWKHVELHTYENIDEFFEKNEVSKMAFLSSHGEKDYLEIPFQDDLFLVFGKESKGLPKSITEKFKNQLYKISIHSKNIRSLNLSNAVSIVVYEGLRRLGA